MTLKNRYNLILFTALLLVSNMQTTSFISLYIINILILGVVCLSIIIINRVINIKLLIITFIIILFLWISTFLELENGSYSKESVIIIYKKLLLISYWAILCSTAISIINKIPEEQISLSLRIIILVMSLYLITQMISFYCFDFRLDFSLLTGGVPSRSYYGTYRPSGFLPEPSVYSGHMMGLLALYFVYRKKIDAIFIIGLFSVLLSQSTAGIILVFIMLIPILGNSFFSKRNFIFIVTLLFITLYLIYPNLIDRYESFISGADTSNNLKLDGLYHFAHNNTLFTGFGVIAKDHYSFPTYYEAIKDYTIFGNIITIYGIIIGTLFLFSFIYLTVKSKLSLLYKIVLIIPLMKLCSPNYSFFFIYLSIYIIIMMRQNKIQ